MTNATKICSFNKSKAYFSKLVITARVFFSPHWKLKNKSVLPDLEEKLFSVSLIAGC